MAILRSVAVLMVVVGSVLGWFSVASGQQLWTKCHITCRCLQDDSVGNFATTIPIDRSPDIGFDADLACKSYGHRVCLDGCNGLKFSYTYQVTSP